MVETLLLCFIHGFKGDEETFLQFPKKLQALVAEKERDLNVRVAVYPKYATRGDLAVCVEIFREWLQNQVTDLEREAGTLLPILHPSVKVILIAHSAGGLVGADALFSILDHRPVSADPDVKLMFPLVLGLMTFDTPYNGLSSSMFAYGVFSQYQNITSMWSIGTSVGSILSSGGSAAPAVAPSQARSWKRWQLLASRTGTYGAIIMGGVAAYANRAEIAQSLSKISKENISDSWSKVKRENLSQGISQVPTYVSRNNIGEGFAWIASHLKFAGALMKQAHLKMRLERLSHLKGVGVVNLYTSLGENGYWTGGYFVPKRTFCAIPASAQERQIFREQGNYEVEDEIAAHCSMFRPEKNPKYEEMAEASRDIILGWLKNDPRAILDDYEPSQEQRERSISDAQQLDDDGNLLCSSGWKKLEDADEWQLQEVLKAQGMPEAADSGTSCEVLNKAAELPLPSEEMNEEGTNHAWGKEGNPIKTTWVSRISRPFSGISIPAMPPIPAIHIPGRQNHGVINGVDQTLEQGAESTVPVEKVSEDVELDKGTQGDP